MSCFITLFFNLTGGFLNLMTKAQFLGTADVSKNYTLKKKKLSKLLNFNIIFGIIMRNAFKQVELCLVLVLIICKIGIESSKLFTVCTVLIFGNLKALP